MKPAYIAIPAVILLGLLGLVAAIHRGYSTTTPGVGGWWDRQSVVITRTHEGIGPVVLGFTTGRTTQAEVEKALGQPDEAKKSETGEDLWIYRESVTTQRGFWLLGIVKHGGGHGESSTVRILVFRDGVLVRK